MKHTLGMVEDNNHSQQTLRAIHIRMLDAPLLLSMRHAVGDVLLLLLLMYPIKDERPQLLLRRSMLLYSSEGYGCALPEINQALG